MAHRSTRRPGTDLWASVQPATSAVLAASEDLSSARVPAHLRERIRKPQVESELRFFVPASLLKDIVEGQKPSLITQSYLPAAHIPTLVERYRIDDWVTYTHEFSIARIRSVKSALGETSYELELKAPKLRCGEAKLSRLILPAPIPLSKKEFEDLAQDATGGTIVKRRYTKEGFVGTGRSATRCSAELDEFLAGGVPLRRFKTPFITLDIEIPDDTLASQLISGEHSFPFLDRCIDMNYVNTELCSSLSNRKVARNGLGSKQMKTLKTLERMLQMLAES
jgi:hypothetical protein